MSLRKAHYVLSTHWDREWYQTFQNFRYSLVDLMDEIIDGFMTNKLVGPFQTDGQSVVMEDYLEVKPERRGLVEKLARDGKFCIGPWYVMPDEFLVSGESLIRNLEMGRDICKSLGTEPSRSGFVCDIFGHCSQLPQIFKLCGVDAGFIWRGLNESQTRNIMWQGADGTMLPCYVFGFYGYGDYAFKVRHCGRHQEKFDCQATANDFEKFLNEEAQASTTDAVLIFDGCDHLYWDKDVYSVMKQYFEKSPPGYTIAHTTLDEYTKDMLAGQDKITKIVSGELRETGEIPEENTRALLAGVLSSRVNLKRHNSRCQSLLCHWAEPFSLAANLWANTAYHYNFIRLSWKWLLQNHAHDSICGCSIDRVHRDMIYRFDQSEDIASRVTSESLKSIAMAVKCDIGEDELKVVLFNQLPRERDDVFTLSLDIPASWFSFKENGRFEEQPSFYIYDDQGKQIDYQRISLSPQKVKVRLKKTKVPEKYNVFEATVAIPAKLPAMGYKTFKIKSAGKQSFVRGLAGRGFLVNSNTMRNEFLQVQINYNGSLTITDKRNGMIYKDLLLFENDADIGDGWDFCSPANNMVYTSAGSYVDIAVLSDGPLLASFLVKVHMAVPRHFCNDTNRRSNEMTELLIENKITLRRNSKRLEIETTFDNTALDHRLRVLFNAGCNAKTYFTDTPFDVVERLIALHKENSSLREMQLETKPQQSWTSVYGSDSGLAIISAGIMESAVRDLPGCPIALTLFRATRNIVFRGKEIGGQMSGRHSFSYDIMPLTGRPEYAELSELGQQLAAGWRYVQLDHADIVNDDSISLPLKDSLLELTGKAILTSVRKSGENWEIRLFNPEKKTIDIELKLNEQFVKNASAAMVVDCVGNKISGLKIDVDNVIKMTLAGKQITTLRIVSNIYIKQLQKKVLKECDNAYQCS